MFVAEDEGILSGLFFSDGSGQGTKYQGPGNLIKNRTCRIMCADDSTSRN